MVNESTASALRDLLSIGTDMAVREQTNEYIDKQGTKHSETILNENLKTTVDEVGYNKELLARISDQATFGSLVSNIDSWGNKVNTDAKNQSAVDPSVYAKNLAPDVYSITKAIEASSTGSQKAALYNTLDKQLQKAQKVQLAGNVDYTRMVAKNQTYANISSTFDLVKDLPPEEAAIQSDDYITKYAEGSNLDPMLLAKAYSDSITGRVADGQLGLGKMIKHSKYKDLINTEALRKAVLQGQAINQANITNTDNPSSLKPELAFQAFVQRQADYLADNPGAKAVNYLKHDAVWISKLKPEFFRDYLGFNTVSLAKTPGDAQRNKIIDTSREMFVQNLAALQAGGVKWTTIKQKLNNDPALSAVVAAIQTGTDTAQAFQAIDVIAEQKALDALPGGKEREKFRDAATDLAIGDLAERAEDLGMPGFFESPLGSTLQGLTNIVQGENSLERNIRKGQSFSPTIDNFKIRMRHAISTELANNPSFNPNDKAQREEFLTKNFTVDAIGDSYSISERGQKTFQGNRTIAETKEYVTTLVDTAIMPAISDIFPKDKEAILSDPEYITPSRKFGYSLIRSPDNNTIELQVNKITSDGLFSTGVASTLKPQTGMIRQADGKWSVLSREDLADYKENPQSSRWINSYIVTQPTMWRFSYEKTDDYNYKPTIEMATPEQMAAYQNNEMTLKERSLWRPTTANGGFKLTPDDLERFIKERNQYTEYNSLYNQTMNNFGEFLYPRVEAYDEMKRGLHNIVYGVPTNNKI